MEKIKLEDVAKLAGVSPTTVSRVINNRGSISEKTRDKVSKAMDDLNYYPNEIARSLFVQKTNSIGILFPTLSDPFFGELATRIEQQLAAYNYKVLICNTNNHLEYETKYLRMLLANQVDGIIVGSHNTPSEIYQTANLPIVAIDRFVSTKVPNIRSDNYQGACLATQHLIDKGCKNIAILSGSNSLDVQYGDLRIKGYLDTIKNHQTRDYIHFVQFEQQIDIQKKETIHFLESYPEVDGVFATGDVLAGLLYSESKKYNRKIEIVGYDGTELFLNYFQNFSTIKQPIEEMVNKAVELILEFIDQDFHQTEKEFVFPIQLIEYGNIS